MSGLSTELYNRCRTTLLQCSEFDTNASLRAVFVTDELHPFRSWLPEAASKSERVDACLAHLLDKRLSDGRTVLPLFLAALRDRYSPGDDLRDELAALVEAVRATLDPSNVKEQPDLPSIQPSAARSPARPTSSRQEKPPPPPLSPRVDGEAIAETPTPERLGWLVWALVSFVMTVVVVYVFSQPLRCLLEYRLTEAIVGLLVALVGGAVTALSSLAPANIRNPLRGIFGGITLVLIVCVLVAVSLPKLSEAECVTLLKSSSPTMTSPVPKYTSTLASPTSTPTATTTPTTAATNAPPIPTFTPLPPSSTPSLDIGSPITRVEDGMVMVYVKGGEFAMGNNHSFEDQRPEHLVMLDTYWIDKFEVSNAQYQKCVTDKVCSVSLFADDPRYNAPDQPAVGVFWTDAVAYCRWVGARLPTEAEWEKAARGTDKRLFPWGNEFDAGKLNSVFDKGADVFAEGAAPIGSFPEGASPYDALDMSGNVWEWTSSLYKEYPYDSLDGREEEKTNGSATRVVRGGSWDNGDENVTTTWRSHFTRGTRFPNTGFRCARSAE